MLDCAFQSGQVDRKVRKRWRIRESMRDVAVLPRNFPPNTLIVALLLAVPIAGMSQQKADEPAATPYSLNVQSRLVVLHVVVTDHAAAIRSALNASAFPVANEAAGPRLVRSRSP